MIYWPYEASLDGAKTCTQRLLEPATVSVGDGEASEPVFVCCRCICGSWHLQTACTSDHCGLWWCTVNHTALSKHSDSMHHRSYALPGTQSRAYRGPEPPPCQCASSHVRPWCSTFGHDLIHSATKQHEGSLPGNVTARH